MPDWVAFYHNVMLTAFVITNTLKFVQYQWMKLLMGMHVLYVLPLNLMI